MRTFTKAAVGAGVALSMLVGVAQAATLSNDQVNAILNLIRSFGADQTVIDNVQASLTGGTPSVDNNQQGENEDNNSNDNRGRDHGQPGLPGMMGSTTPWMNGQGAPGQNASTTPGIPGLGEHRSDRAKCVLLNRNLSQGTSGDDVKNLQQLLKDEGEFDGEPTGFFGSITSKAVAMWQEHQGIASSTQGGAIGPMTRKFMQERCRVMPPMGSTTPQQ